VLRDSIRNRVYHNSIIDNWEQQGFDDTGENTWGDGYPSGGNYWSDYAGADFFRGVYQNESGSDGIGDAPYIIDAYNSDHYPLMKPYAGPVDLGLVISVSRTVVPFGYNFTVSTNVTVINYGLETEISDFTLQMPTISFEQELTIDSRNSTIFAFAWNTTGFGKGNYTITSSLEPASGETDITDNTYSGWIVITIPGDINGDHWVNAKDAIILGKAFNSKRGEARFTPNADLNDDDWCNAKDAIILGTYFGQNW
jgi:hypothetical protein